MTQFDDLSQRKEELENLLDLYGKISRVAGVLVVIGLIVEFIAITLSFFYEAKSRLVDACGLFLVTLGVAGEIKSEFDSHRVEQQLRIVNEKLLGIAKALIRDRDDLIAKLQHDTAKAIEAATQARLELAKFKAPRNLTPEQQQRVASKISGFVKSQRVIVTAHPLTVESGTIAEQILSSIQVLFSDADWFQGNNFRILTNAGAVSGVGVFSTPDKRSVDFANALTKALNDEDIGADTVPSMSGCEGLPNVNPDDPSCFMVFVVVGTKE